jgi:hypothetical protein
MEKGLRPNFIGEPSFVMLRRSLMESVGKFREDMPQGLDTEYWLRCLLRADWYFERTSLGMFRVHGQAASARNDREGLGLYDRLGFYDTLLHLLPADDYEMSLESTSSLATSTELRKSKDLELWGLIKDVNELTDPETGTVYSIKKFKILMKLFEDYGWEPSNYVAENKPAPVVPNPADVTPPGEVGLGDAPAIDPMTGSVPAKEPLPGNEMGAMFGGAMKQ